MPVSLIDHLKTVPDFRRARGIRYPLWVVLLLLILGIMSECQGYCALETFARRHKAALLQALGLPLTRLPSDSTFRLILQRLDYAVLMQVFNQWAQQSVPVEPGSGWSIDGKSLAGTLVDHTGSAQNFVAIVSLYCQHQGCVLQMSAFENQHESELAVVHQLLSALQLQEVVLTLDALHAQKKRSPPSCTVATSF
jgi:hypothetical protein